MAGNSRSEKLETLGMPFTNIVTSAYPAGKPMTEPETNELADQLVEDGNTVIPVSRLRTWTIGQSEEESWVAFPPEPPETPRKPVPDRASAPPDATEETVAICGCQAALNPMFGS